MTGLRHRPQWPRGRGEDQAVTARCDYFERGNAPAERSGCAQTHHERVPVSRIWELASSMWASVVRMTALSSAISGLATA